MNHPHQKTLVLFLLLAFAPGIIEAQKTAPATPDRARGIQLYQQGDFASASQTLRAFLKHYKNDVTAWHYLGLAFARLGKTDDARKAHEKAAKLADANLTRSLDRQVRPDKMELAIAAESAGQYVALSPKLSKKTLEEWRNRAEILRFFANQTAAGLEVYSGKEVTTKARVLSKPEPVYDEESRRNQVTGTVILRCIFAADGTVRAIRVVSGLNDGLDREAIEAARHIRFIPATREGRPVSMWMELQYNFNLY